MAAKAKAPASAPHADGSVDAFMRTMDHPMKAEIKAARQLILAADPSISEGIKWNGPSFMSTDYFATLNNPNNPRTKDHVALLMHTGVKAKGLDMKSTIADPEGLLKWIAKDRAMITFENAAEIKKKGKALQAIVKQWIKML
jgi:hypothetical protein